VPPLLVPTGEALVQALPRQAAELESDSVPVPDWVLESDSASELVLTSAQVLLPSEQARELEPPLEPVLARFVEVPPVHAMPPRVVPPRPLVLALRPALVLQLDPPIRESKSCPAGGTTPASPLPSALRAA
jgi:hypothetical protein